MGSENLPQDKVWGQNVLLPKFWGELLALPLILLAENVISQKIGGPRSPPAHPLEYPWMGLPFHKIRASENYSFWKLSDTST